MSSDSAFRCRHPEIKNFRPSLPGPQGKILPLILVAASWLTLSSPLHAEEERAKAGDCKPVNKWTWGWDTAGMTPTNPFGNYTYRERMVVVCKDGKAGAAAVAKKTSEPQQREDRSDSVRKDDVPMEIRISGADHNVMEQGEPGMRIRANGDTRGMAGLLCLAEFGVFTKEGKPLMPSSTNHAVSGGILGTRVVFRPDKDIFHGDTSLFIPYGAFQLPPGQHELVLKGIGLCTGMKALALSNDMNFTFKTGR